ncbi:MAG: ATP synthase F0 subunit C [Anaerolineae bacterium]|nr:ATP synthase F0 subunit C [Anaerolineae bacterium]
MQLTPESFKFLAVGLVMGLGTFGPGLGLGILFWGALQAIGRNPEAEPQIRINMFIGMAFTEAVAIYVLVVALILLFVV